MTDEHKLMADIAAELARARAKFPGKNVTFATLVEEVAGLSTAILEESSDRVREEAVQVAVMAIRIVLDGDHVYESWRVNKGLDPLDPQARSEKQADETVALSDHTDLIQRLRSFAVRWGDLPSIAPHIESAPGVTTGCVIGAADEAADTIEAQAAKIAEMKAEQAWQPIETAPKNGATILLFGRIDPDFREIRADKPFVTTGYFDTLDEAWCMSGATWSGPFFEPTHWMPLPPTPQEGE